MTKPCNCSDPLSGAPEYVYRLDSRVHAYAKKMDRTFLVKTESGELQYGNVGDYIVEAIGPMAHRHAPIMNRRVRVFATDFEEYYTLVKPTDETARI
jgi:hypothetical protein